jgi:6-phosphofructokinase
MRSAAQFISEQIQFHTNLETRQTILGYIQRGGTPSPFDRLLATSYGAKATELISQGKFNQMVALQNNKITSIPLSETGGKLQIVPKDYSLLNQARHLGTCFGDDSQC